MSVLSTNDGLAQKRKRNLIIAFSIAVSAILYPCLAAAIVWVHWVVVHIDINKRTQAHLLLLTFPMSLACGWSLLICIADGRGKTRALGVVGSLIGIILNVIFSF
jgi:hypothetical protein